MGGTISYPIYNVNYWFQEFSLLMYIHFACAKVPDFRAFGCKGDTLSSVLQFSGSMSLLVGPAVLCGAVSAGLQRCAR